MPDKENREHVKGPYFSTPRKQTEKNMRYSNYNFPLCKIIAQLQHDHKLITTNYQPTSPPITTSPPSTAPEPISSLMVYGTTDAYIGNSTGLVLTTRTTLPDPGVGRKQKNGRSQPSSVYSSMTCLLLLGPWRSSILALSGRPSVLRRTCTLSTDGSNG